ncbi:glutamine synthetase family protein [Marinomonas mediterranea]|jgi:Glutamine synthetase|uniref:Glutamate--putrescine ligase n=1 Tax=Marinomonas mediterranea (strain ATCC 700492 / JCM 21426 / NBRC 103028 / MMB-1) TaxID=717774 RepID=F2JXL2_MARM1|nr:glutamine synthetase family protein [Marinomonas mediterranea]ADZ93010.1 Glutamate--putrescine ligase [Marinomonas mediterranea MMB-1]WCN19028.1 glutamine synthetase [Marinomonas mediterranea MMB-1]
MKALEAFLKEHAITEVESTLADMTGNARGKFYPTYKFLAEKGGRIPETILVQSVTGDWAYNHYDIVDPRDRDMVLVPDPNTLRLVPWADEPTAQVINDCYDTDGELHRLSSRTILRNILKLYEEKGLKPVIAPEVEFYLIQKNADPDNELKPAAGRSGKPESARRSYSIDAVNEFNPFIDTMYSYCEAQGLDVDTLIHESGAAQMEINFLHGDPLDLADQVFVFKRTLREAAIKHGVHATFMAKPMQNEPGSAMHIHQSLLNSTTGENVFDDNGKPSQRFYHYLGGLQKYTPNAISFFAPNVNSYRRFAPEMAAPINMEWGIDNRTVGLRVPKASPEATRIENRFPGADCNPYLAIAATLACGYLGLTEELEPTAPYDSTDAPPDHQNVEIARTLEEGLRLLDACEPICNIMGRAFVEAYVGVKHSEFETFNRVISSWEREHLLLNV